MNNIQNINGEYLKFYFTTNSSMPTILKNTGSVVIVNKSGDNYSYNEFWVADEFIATGYGFGSANIKNVLDKYGDIYTDEFGTAYTSYIDYKFEEAHNSYISSLNYTDEIHEDIINNFVSNYGNSSETYVIYNNENIKLSYLTYLLKFAEYKDAEIESTRVQLYGYSFATPNIDYGNIIAESVYKDTETFYLPIGSKLSRIKLDANIKLNDVSPANSELGIMYISYSKYTNGVEGNNFIDQNYTITNSFPDETLNDDSSIHQITIDVGSSESNEFGPYIKEGLQPIITAYIDYKGTSIYSYYPELEANTGIQSYSTENAIKPNRYNLGNIYAEGCFEITYLTSNTSNLPFISSLHPDPINATAPNKKMIIDNKVFIDVNKGYTYFGIPKNFSITDAKWIHRSADPLMSNPHNESYMNWTGDIYKDASNTYQYMRCHITYLPQENDQNNYIKYIKYDHYVTYLPEKTTLFFEFEKSDNEQVIFQFNDLDDSSNQLASYIFNKTDNFVQNEMYNASHWFAPVDLTYMYIR